MSLYSILDHALANTNSRQIAFQALNDFWQQILPVRLFTVMTIEENMTVARRAFSNEPEAYPVSGTKPVERNTWFNQIAIEKKIFVANTIEDIAKVFPDHATIASLGCESVVNYPVFANERLLGTVNLLDGPGFFTADRLDCLTQQLPLAARATFLTAQTLEPEEPAPTL